MKQQGAFSSLRALSDDERYRRATELHFKLEEAVPFRIVDPRVLGRLVEARLHKRKDFHIRNYAEKRESVRREKPEKELNGLLETMAERFPEVAPQQRILLSLELEALMDQSYAEPLLRRLYEQALAEGKEVSFSETEAFTPVFRTLLLEKNGFDRFRRDEGGEDALRVKLTPPQARSDRSSLAFAPRPLPSRAMARFPCEGEAAGPALAAGLMEQRLREKEASAGEAPACDLFALGYCLLGPGMVLLLQSLHGEQRPILPRGRGSGFLTTTGQRLRSSWPDFPQMVGDTEGSLRFGLFPGKLVERSLLPESRDKQDRSCLIKRKELAPLDYLLPPLRHLFMASTEGSSKPVLQSAAAAFVADYAESTRGIWLPLSKENVLEHWRRQFLAPPEELVMALLRDGPYRSARPHGVGGTGGRLLRSGCWPTASYLGASPWRRKVMRMVAAKPCTEIEWARAKADR
jgi:hypothetical protein